MTAGIKRCSKCKEEKAVEEFYLHTKDWRRSECVSCYKEWQKQYRKENPDLISKQRKQHYKNNPEPAKKRAIQWRLDNIEHCREVDKLYFRNNLDKCYALSAERRARKLNQTPVDANMVQIQRMYSICCYMNSISINCKWNVDHIFPVSKGGLHHQDNLQILDAIANRKKSNKTK